MDTEEKVMQVQVIDALQKTQITQVKFTDALYQE